MRTAGRERTEKNSSSHPKAPEQVWRVARDLVGDVGRSGDGGELSCAEKDGMASVGVGLEEGRRVGWVSDLSTHTMD